MLKIIILLSILFFCMFNLSAQIESNIKLKIEAGFLSASDEESSGFFDVENFAPFFRIEPTLKTSENTFLGLRIGVRKNSK